MIGGPSPPNTIRQRGRGAASGRDTLPPNPHGRRSAALNQEPTRLARSQTCTLAAIHQVHPGEGGPRKACSSVDRAGMAKGQPLLKEWSRPRAATQTHTVAVGTATHTQHKHKALSNHNGARLPAKEEPRLHTVTRPSENAQA